MRSIRKIYNSYGMHGKRNKYIGYKLRIEYSMTLLCEVHFYEKIVSLKNYIGQDKVMLDAYILNYN